MAFFTNPSRISTIPRYSPQQVGQLDKLANLGLSNLQNSQQNFNIGALEDQARKQFQTQTVPSIANRFLAGNTRNSSGFQSALASGGADLESSLAALRNQFGQQQQQTGLNQLQMGLQPQFESLYEPESPNFLGQLGISTAQSLPRLLGALLTGGGSEGVGALMQLLQLLGGNR